MHQQNPDGYDPKLPNTIILIPNSITTTNPNIPRDETTNVIVFKRPFTLNNAARNEPSKSNMITTISQESGKGVKTCGTIKPRIINIINNTNETKLKCVLTTSTSLSELPFSE